MITDKPWAGKNLPPLNDHAFARLVRVQVHTTKSMDQIASDLGVEVTELCEWIMAYREPKKVRPPLAYAKYGPHVSPERLPGEHARRFAAWRRQQEGAAQTRRMLEAAD